MDYLTLQHKFRRIFGLDDISKNSKWDRMLTYGGILYDDVKLKGGLYIAIAVVLAPYFFKDAENIDDFLNEIEDIRELELDEIDKNRVEDIINKFDSIIQAVEGCK